MDTRPTQPGQMYNSYMAKKKKSKKMTLAQDKAYDKKHGLKEGSKADIAQDKMSGVKDKKAHKKHKMGKKCKTCGK